MGFTISKDALMAGDDIFLEGIGTLHQPTLKEIRKYSSVFGEGLADVYLTLFSFDLPTFLKKTVAEERFETIDPEVRNQIRLFDLLISDTEMRELLNEALSFFISENVVFSPTYEAFRVSDFCSGQIIGFVNRDNYEDFTAAVLIINGITPPKPKKYKNQAAREIEEMLEAGRKKAAARSSNNRSLPNIISAMSIWSNTYNLLNVYDLTMYQLINQFERLSTKVQLDVIGTRWAAWGTEDFDFSIWCKGTSK